MSSDRQFHKNHHISHIFYRYCANKHLVGPCYTAPRLNGRAKIPNLFEAGCHFFAYYYLGSILFHRFHGAVFQALVRLKTSTPASKRLLSGPLYSQGATVHGRSRSASSMQLRSDNNITCWPKYASTACLNSHSTF